MNDKMFRKESIERISSPEQLTDYIHVTSPAGWMLLGAIIVLLAGICVWGIFGRLDTTLTVAAQSRDGAVVLYVKEADIGKVETGLPVRIGENEYRITGHSEVPAEITDEVAAYAMHISGLKQGEWVYTAYIDGTLPEGIYTAEIIVDQVAPLAFVWN